MLVENKSDVQYFSDFKVDNSEGTADSEVNVAENIVSIDENAITVVPTVAENIVKIDENAARVEHTKSTSTAGRIMASPAAKWLAAAKSINLAAITPTGPSGRIIKADVLNFKPVVQQAPAQVVKQAPEQFKVQQAIPHQEKVNVVKTSKLAQETAVTSTNYKDLPVSNIRKIIATRLTESTSTIPHFYLTVEINVDRILKYYLK